MPNEQKLADYTMPIPAIADQVAQTVANNPLVLLDAATASSVQTALASHEAKINAILAALRTAKVLST